MLTLRAWSCHVISNSCVWMCNLCSETNINSTHQQHGHTLHVMHQGMHQRHSLAVGTYVTCYAPRPHSLTRALPRSTAHPSPLVHPQAAAWAPFAPQHCTPTALCPSASCLMGALCPAGRACCAFTAHGLTLEAIGMGRGRTALRSGKLRQKHRPLRR